MTWSEWDSDHGGEGRVKEKLRKAIKGRDCPQDARMYIYKDSNKASFEFWGAFRYYGLDPLPEREAFLHVPKDSLLKSQKAELLLVLPPVHFLQLPKDPFLLCTAPD